MKVREKVLGVVNMKKKPLEVGKGVYAINKNSVVSGLVRFAQLPIRC